jgi:DNA-binding transcriptional ArsR family regulator
LQFLFFPIYLRLSHFSSLHLDLVKLFGSRSRVKLLEKLVIEDVVSRSNTGFFIRELCRDVDEQINAVRRELMNLEALGILKSYEQNKKKYYQMDHTSPIYNELREMFLKAYDVMGPIKNFFKGRKTLDLVTISQGILDFRNETTNNIVDIFIIGELDKIEFNNFLEKTFFGKKVKYAIMTLEDFTNRLEYNDKLVLSILAQKGNIFLRDRLEIESTVDAKLRAMKIFTH